jgi:hypothetical protein
MVHWVHQQLAPEQVARPPDASVHVCDLPLQVGVLQAGHSGHGLLVHDLKSWGKRLKGSRTFDVGGLQRELELALFDEPLRSTH